MAKNSKTKSFKCDFGGIVTDKLTGGKTCSKLNGCQNRGTSACKCQISKSQMKGPENFSWSFSQKTNIAMDDLYKANLGGGWQ